MKNYFFIIMTMVFAIGCRKEEKHLPPGNPSLLYPLSDAICMEGTLASLNRNYVLFTWSASANTDRYDISLKNLVTGEITIHSSTEPYIGIPLNRNTPYSWHVISKSDHLPQTGKSDNWRFYSSGPGITSHPPFPAETVFPLFGTNVPNPTNKIVLDWEGSDSDKDVLDYDIYFGTSTTPPLLKGKVTESQLPDVVITSGVKHYWKIVTRDKQGNTSESELFQFSAL